MKVVLILFCYVLVSPLVQAELDKYRSRRKDILDGELKMSIGGNIVLDEKESIVNEVLMEWKKQELDQTFPRHFNFSGSYFNYKDVIKTSRVYQFIRTMPKGAALHIHASALLGPDYFLNITYKENLYVCVGKTMKFKFSYLSPKDTCESQWKLMSDVRKSSGNVHHFDMELRKKFELDDSSAISPWQQFTYIFGLIYPLWSFRPVWEQFFYEQLKQFRDDKIMYMEVRSSFPELYELDGTQYDEIFFINTTKQIAERFVKEHPDFLGVKVICSFNRQVNRSSVRDLLAVTKKTKSVFPDFVAGFDLVGHEDLGASLMDILPELEAAKSDIDYFFHAGETNWYGTPPDENLIDAVLLGTKRIGHGYALEKHPLILEKVINNKIGVEVNLVSNNVLNYVSDLRNHPLASFISQGLPVVVSSDDPGFWDALPLTTDFYLAFVGVASRSHDLRLLKQFALNSIEYSALKPDKKIRAYSMFDVHWKRFIDGFIKTNNLTHYVLSRQRHSSGSEADETINSGCALPMNLQLLIGLQIWTLLTLSRSFE